MTLQERGEELEQGRHRELLRHLAEQAQRLDRLLSDLLDLDRLRHGSLIPDFAETDVSELVARITSVYGVAVHSEPVIADVDAPKVERIVENLVANAVRHTPNGTDVSVRVESQDGGVLIVVDDRGPGVPEAEREAIFGMFQRGGDPDAGGAGRPRARGPVRRAAPRTCVGRGEPRRRGVVSALFLPGRSA